MPPPPPLSSSETHNNSNRGTWYPYTNSSHFDTNMAVILVILFCALLCALALNLSIRCFLRPFLRRNNPEQQQQQQPDPEKPNSQPRLSPPSPPTLIYSSGVKLAGAEADCAICLSEFVNGEELRVLPRCQHGFHVKCIQGWLSSHSSCPTCRSSSLITSPEKSCTEQGENGTEFDVESQSQSQPPQVPLQQIGLGSSGSE